VKFLKKRTRPDWTFPKVISKSEKKVWRLIPGSGVLVAEFRDVDKKSVGFAGIDLASGSLVWENDQLKEEWWITLNTVYRDTVLLQQFARPDMPTPDKIFALDLHTGKLLWQNHEVSFMNVANDTIYCLKRSFSSETIIGLNLRTGIESEIPSSELPDKIDDPLLELALPEFIEFTSGGPQEQTDRDKPVSPMDLIAHVVIPSDARQPTLLKFEQKNVFGFYVLSGKDEKGTTLYDACIVVTNSEGKILFEDIADKNVYVPLADFYFGVDGRLIYVRNSEEIVGLKLD
jgi:hypothetical protein